MTCTSHLCMKNNQEILKEEPLDSNDENELYLEKGHPDITDYLIDFGENMLEEEEVEETGKEGCIEKVHDKKKQLYCSISN